MHALVLWSDPQSTNLGVRVLAAGTGELARAAFGSQTEIAHQGYGPGDSPVRIGDARRLARRLINARHDEFVDWVRGFDVVVDTRAGDSFSDIYGLQRHLTMSLAQELAHRAKVPVVLGPQTIGPFDTHRGRWLATRSIRQARLVMARDEQSFGVGQRLRGRCLLTTDVVFALPPPADSEPEREILLNVSGLLWQPNSHVSSDHYRDVVRRLISGFQARGRAVSLLAHVLDSEVADNDVPVCRKLGAELGLEVVVPEDLDQARSAVSSASLVVGSRMHACLNAISVGTPAVALAYSRKFEPLLNQIGWKFTVDLRTIIDPAAAVLRAAESDGLAEQVLRVRERASDEMVGVAAALGRVVDQ